MKTFSTIFLLMTGLVFRTTLPAQDIQITASVDKNPVAANQEFVYQVEVSGESQNLPDIDLPDFSDFRVVGGPSTSSSVQIINFKISASKSYTVVLMPRETGTFKIGPASTSFKGKSYSSNVIELTVTKPTTAPPQSAQPRDQNQNMPEVDVSQLVFLKAMPSRKSAYVNEEITLTYKIYFRANISGYEASQLPQAVGCWVEEYPVPRRPSIYTETVNGVRFNVAEIKKVAVFPSRSGEITVSPLNLTVEVAIPRQRPRGPSSLFDDFFSDPFTRTVKQNISSGEVKLNAISLPVQGKPDNFSGLVGNFSITSSLDKNNITTDEALTYKVKISGTGLLKFLNTIPVQFPPDFEVFDPKVSESVDKSGNLIRSTKEFEYVLIPRIPGEQKIKSAELYGFNPSQKSYQKMVIPEYRVEVSKGKDLALTPGSGSALSREEVRLLGQDIRFIKDVPDNLRPMGSLPYKNIWFYLSLGCPLLVLVGAVVYRNHQEKMSSNVQYARSRRAQKMAQKRLSEAKSYLKQNKGTQFYGAVSSGIVGYLADKHNRPAAGLVKD
ncbi:MAG: protein BatD, partial [Calditrichaeota bacterium]